MLRVIAALSLFVREKNVCFSVFVREVPNPEETPFPETEMSVVFVRKKEETKKGSWSEKPLSPLVTFSGGTRRLVRLNSYKVPDPRLAGIKTGASQESNPNRNLP